MSRRESGGFDFDSMDADDAQQLAPESEFETAVSTLARLASKFGENDGKI